MDNFNNPAQLPFASNGFLYNPDTDCILLVKRDGNASADKYKWSLFGGRSDPGETPYTCFIRETKEELNIQLKNEDVIFFDRYFHEKKRQWWYIFYAKSKLLKADITLREGEDFDWIPISKVFSYDLSDDARRVVKFFVKKLTTDLISSLRKQDIKVRITNKNITAWVSIVFAIVLGLGGFYLNYNSFNIQSEELSRQNERFLKLLPLDEAKVILSDSDINIYPTYSNNIPIIALESSLNNIGNSRAEKVHFRTYRFFMNENVAKDIEVFDDELVMALYPQIKARFGVTNIPQAFNGEKVILVYHVSYFDTHSQQEKNDVFWFQYTVNNIAVFSLIERTIREIDKSRLEKLFSETKNDYLLNFIQKVDWWQEQI